ETQFDLLVCYPLFNAMRCKHVACHAHFRGLPREPANHTRDEIDTQSRQYSNCQIAFMSLTNLLGAYRKISNRNKGAFDILDQGLRFGGGHNAALTSLKKLDLQLVLKAVKHPTNGRLTASQSLSGP